MSVNKESSEWYRRRTGAEELQGSWLVTGRYYCYGNEDYPDEEYLTVYETPVWKFENNGRAQFSDLAFPFRIDYTYRIVNDRIALRPDDGSAEELYRMEVAGNRASLYFLEQTWRDDGAASCLTETIRIELKRLP